MVYEWNLALNNLQWLICHKTQPNQNKPCWVILYQSQFNSYGFQLYTEQKCIMSALVGLFYAKVN